MLKLLIFSSDKSWLEKYFVSSWLTLPQTKLVGKLFWSISLISIILAIPINSLLWTTLIISEFFGDNTKQWSWHNVPGDVRSKLFPDKPVKTTNDVDAAPYLKYRNIKSKRGLPYATGEIYYCNWPQVVTKYGNKKMFLTDKWAFPYEQTWMSYMFQETIKGNIKPAMLLLTPTEHDRFDFYDGKLRKES